MSVAPSDLPIRHSWTMWSIIIMYFFFYANQLNAKISRWWRLRRRSVSYMMNQLVNICVRWWWGASTMSMLIQLQIIILTYWRRNQAQRLDWLWLEASEVKRGWTQFRAVVPCGMWVIVYLVRRKTQFSEVFRGIDKVNMSVRETCSALIAAYYILSSSR